MYKTDLLYIPLFSILIFIPFKCQCEKNGGFLLVFSIKEMNQTTGHCSLVHLVHFTEKK